MNVQRGDIVLADFPHAVGARSKRRPVVVIQANYYNRRISNVVVALITSNLKNASDAAHYLLEINTPAGRRSGLSRDSVVSCINLVTLHETRIGQQIGKLTRNTMRQVDDCIKWALGLHSAS